MRRLSMLLLVMSTAACGATQTSTQGAHDPTPAPTSIRLVGGGVFVPYTEGVDAVVYDPKLAPKGSNATVTVESVDSTTVSTLTVKKFKPMRTYGAHLHTKPCGAKPDDSGPHFQHDHSHTPGMPSEHLANPRNEVWLDFTTDGTGSATATARQDWSFPPDRLPGSLIIHERATTSQGPEAGTAGARIACLTLKRQ
ncbi:superoxide dismutase family protein [Sinosporangium siamense]|uniref:Superoxide dismutase copper/zinc binding domain-containing protein n=1 Tax=Sinosporangium siamense TaxID=1367973 RepID=A0A919RFE8_9ACTN|nr:superoxide dismutase family protein [Sinosporangium siamense]GII92893.1 hypothetical protein Ssi02_31240 [Sinosporangium siamense]